MTTEHILAIAFDGGVHGHEQKSASDVARQRKTVVCHQYLMPCEFEQTLQETTKQRLRGKTQGAHRCPAFLLWQSKCLQCAEKWYLDELRQQTKHLTGTGTQVRPFFFFYQRIRQFVMCVYSGIQVRYFCPLLCQEVYISIFSCVQAPPVME